MANLDTRSKRASSVAWGLSFVAAPVLPDGTLDQGDRQHVAFTYSGIAAGALVAPTDVYTHDASHHQPLVRSVMREDHYAESGSHFGWTMPFSRLPFRLTLGVSNG